MTEKRFTLRAAVYLILIKDNKILLQKRAPKVPWGAQKYGLIAGHLDGNETIAESMAREAKEEAGIIIDPKDLKIVHVMHRNSDFEYIDYFLTVSKWQGTPKIMEPERHEELAWFPLNDLPKNILEYIPLAIEYSKKGVAFSEYGWE